MIEAWNGYSDCAKAFMIYWCIITPVLFIPIYYLFIRKKNIQGEENGNK